MEPLVCLLIDDDHEDHEIFNIALSQTKLPVSLYAISNPTEAIEQLNKNIIQPDVIFIDVNMPKIGAVECISRIKAFENLKEITLIAISTFASESDRNELSKLGVRFITKPSRIDHYESILADILSEKLALHKN